MVLCTILFFLTVLTGQYVADAQSPVSSSWKCGEEKELFPKGQVPGEVPGMFGPEKSIPVGKEHHVVNVTNPTVTRFCSNSSSSGRDSPLRSSILVAPGGGYVFLTIDKEGSDVAKSYNRMNMDAFVLKYRVPARPSKENLPKWWAPLQDAQRAMSIVRSFAQQDGSGLDPNKIGFLGFSAGGHLTAHISTAFEKRIYPDIDNADKVSSRPDFSVLVYPWMIIENNSANSTTLASEITVSTDTPPAFLAANQDDTTAPFQNSVFYYLSLHSFGIPHSRLNIFPTGGHGFGECQQISYQECCTWVDLSKLWLQDLGILPGFPTSTTI